MSLMTSHSTLHFLGLLRNTPTKCDVDGMKGCGERWRTYIQTDRFGFVVRLQLIWLNQGWETTNVRHFKSVKYCLIFTQKAFGSFISIQKWIYLKTTLCHRPVKWRHLEVFLINFVFLSSLLHQKTNHTSAQTLLRLLYFFFSLHTSSTQTSLPLCASGALHFYQLALFFKSVLLAFMHCTVDVIGNEWGKAWS